MDDFFVIFSVQGRTHGLLGGLGDYMSDGKKSTAAFYKACVDYVGRPNIV